MKIVIIAAMQKELQLLLSLIREYEKLEINGFEVYKGYLADHDIILAECGIGKVNSSLRTRSLIETFHPDLILNSGVAGGIDERVPIGTVLVADHVAYHDVWCGPGTVYGQADDCPLFYLPYEPGLKIINAIADTEDYHIEFGLLCSGDKFITSEKEVDDIKSHFPNALGCDMESASIAQTCFKENVPFMIVRVMSDRPGGGENITEYQNFWNTAPEKTFNIVSQLILNLKK